MQPGLRLVLESYEWGPNSVGPLLEKWAGRYPETDHTEGMWRYSVTSKHPEDDSIVQHTMIQVQKCLELHFQYNGLEGDPSTAGYQSNQW